MELLNVIFEAGGFLDKCVKEIAPHDFSQLNVSPFAIFSINYISYHTVHTTTTINIESRYPLYTLIDRIVCTLERGLFSASALNNN